MKILILIICAFTATITTNAQTLLTTSGLVNIEKPEQNFIVIDVPNKSAAELYEDVCVRLNRAYKFPNHTQSKVENKSIQVSGVATNSIFSAKFMGVLRY